MLFLNFKGLLKYVNYRDYQLFAKRFRKYLFTKIGSYEKISSYVVSEYSPKTFRPHFHILFFFDSDEVAKNIRQAVFQSWKLGRVDTQLARDSAGSYVSGYLNSVVTLPSIFTDVSFTKNKSRFSKLFGYESFRKTIEVPEQAVQCLSERIRFVRNGKSCEFAPPFRISLGYCHDSYHTAVILLSKLEQFCAQFVEYYNSLDETNPLKKKLLQKYPNLFTPI